MNGTYANVEWIDGLRIQLRSKARTTILLWENCECCRIFRVFDYFMIFVIRDLSAHCSYIFFSMQTPFDAYYIPLISPHTKQQPKQWNIIHLLHFLCFHLFYKNFTILFVMCIHLNLFSSLLFSFQVCIQVIICSYVRHISSSLENIFVFERWCCSFFFFVIRSNSELMIRWRWHHSSINTTHTGACSYCAETTQFSSNDVLNFADVKLFINHLHLHYCINF